MILGRICQCVTMQCHRIQTLKHEIQNVRLLDVRQLDEQLMDILQWLRQCVQRNFEFAHRRVPIVLAIVVIIINAFAFVDRIIDFRLHFGQ